VSRGLVVGAAVLAAALAACVATASPPSATPTGRASITVFGAASLKGALEAAKAAFEEANPGSTLTIATDASATLATQIEQGAPADVFLSADTANPQRLVDGGLVDGGLVPFAGNELAIIVPTGNPGEIASPADLARAGVTVIAAGDDVPVTGYATQLVRNLARQPGYPSDFAARYAANVASREDNARAVLGKIELGEGDAAIVYATDALASTTVEVVAVPAAANVAASYAGVVLKETRDPVAARAFLAWLTGPDGQAILGGLGFRPAP
jgi:molybdate transport system substrate-binding protein